MRIYLYVHSAGSNAILKIDKGNVLEETQKMYIVEKGAKKNSRYRFPKEGAGKVKSVQEYPRGIKYEVFYTEEEDEKARKDILSFVENSMKTMLQYNKAY